MSEKGKGPANYFYTQDDDSEVHEAVRKYDEDKLYTYADYESWDDDKRYELIDGVAYLISAPSITHQSILGELYLQLALFLKGKKCKVFIAPCDVCLTGLGDDDTTVVQPDVLVVCDESKIADGKRCNGAPDMTIEVLSPSSTRRDLFLKLEKYKSAGVREYWIVSPDTKTVNVHILVDGQYVITSYQRSDTVPVSILDGCNIELTEVFQ